MSQTEQERSDLIDEYKTSDEYEMSDGYGTGGNVEAHLGAGYFSVGAICGVSKEVTVGEDNWFMVCTQLHDHTGPHVGLFTWGINPTTEEER